jgi:arsenite methyltransferase
METRQGPVANPPSLETVVEAGMLKLESLHPGGLELTRELAELCKIQKDAKVLDIACGTGETACFLAERFAARVYGVDHSDQMIERAKAKAQTRGLAVEFRNADAASLPFGDAEFDAVICECTLCFVDKERTLAQMVRLVRPGGYVGIHDLCWKEDAPDPLKRTLAEIEGERPETLEGWQRLLHQAGLVDIRALDKAKLMSRWMGESRKQLGLDGQATLALRIIRQWGLRGLWRVLKSERVFSSGFLSYGIVVGIKR